VANSPNTIRFIEAQRGDLDTRTRTRTRTRMMFDE